LVEYFKPGRVVSSYGGGKDTVEAFFPEGFMGGWGVKVRGEDGMLRVHSTSPSQKEIEAVLKKEGKEHLLDPIKGATIKADILPSADKFLDWDKPLSEQGKDVVANLKKAGIVDKDGYVGSINGAKHINDVTGDDLHQIIKEQYANNYGDKKLLSVKAKGPDEAVSKYLSELGIPGIRYLDQGSRSAGKGTYNYVVFNDKDVKILERK
jgi:hypothetical protein